MLSINTHAQMAATCALSNLLYHPQVIIIGDLWLVRVSVQYKPPSVSIDVFSNLRRYCIYMLNHRLFFRQK